MTDYENIDTKALIMQQNALLTAILDELKAMNGHSEDPPKQVKCTVCMSQIPADEIKEHGKSCFGWMEAMGQETLENKYDTTVNE